MIYNLRLSTSISIIQKGMKTKLKHLGAQLVKSHRQVKKKKKNPIERKASQKKTNECVANELVRLNVGAFSLPLRPYIITEPKTLARFGTRFLLPLLHALINSRFVMKGFYVDG